MDFNDLMKNPEKYGFCSFEQFRKDKDKWRKRPEAIFEMVQQAGHQHKRQLRRVKYKIAGHFAKTLEEVQRIAKNEGLDTQRLDIWPEIVDLGGHRCDILVEFLTYEQIQVRRRSIALRKSIEASATM